LVFFKKKTNFGWTVERPIFLKFLIAYGHLLTKFSFLWGPFLLSLRVKPTH
jgi:hypothetical protein